MLEALPPDFPKGGTWLEPCAGTGNIIRAIASYPGLAKPDKWLAVDLSRSAEEAGLNEKAYNLTWKTGNFLEPWEGRKVDVIFTNPPYSFAEDFITHSLKIAPNVIMLLRLNFLASEKRAAFMRAHTPDVYLLPNRPSFTTDGHTDSIEYAWFSFHPMGSARTDGRLKILNSTPKGERGRGPSVKRSYSPLPEVSDPPSPSP